MNLLLCLTLTIFIQSKLYNILLLLFFLGDTDEDSLSLTEQFYIPNFWIGFGYQKNNLEQARSDNRVRICGLSKTDKQWI